MDGAIHRPASGAHEAIRANEISITMPIRPAAVSVAAPRHGAATWLSWLVPALLVIGWEALARFGKIRPYILPAPTKVLATWIFRSISGRG